jgi:hypothetical protein
VKRRIIEHNRWIVRSELSHDGKTLTQWPELVEASDRVKRALDSPAVHLLRFRCGVKGCGLVIGELMSTEEEGLLCLAFRSRPYGLATISRPRRKSSEDVIDPFFLDEESDLVFVCGRHHRTKIGVADVEREQRSGKTEIRVRVRERREDSTPID